MFKKLSAGIKYNRLLSREKVFYMIYPEFKVRDFLDYGKWYLPPLLAASVQFKRSFNRSRSKKD